MNAPPVSVAAKAKAKVEPSKNRFMSEVDAMTGRKFKPALPEVFSRDRRPSLRNP
jgi:hypothetical protein